jgi:uncharacterized membrane protein YgcG
MVFRRVSSGFLLVALLALFIANPLSAQTRSLVWDKWDVIIDQVDTANNTFRVRELYVVDFSGTFRFGSAYIPLARLGSITDVSVTQDGRRLSYGCNNAPGTFCTFTEDGNFNIVYNFFAPVTNQTTQIELVYTVSDAIRAYDDDQRIFWDAIPADHFGFPIQAATIRIELPDGAEPREGIDSVEVYGVPGTVQVNGGTIIATATRPLGGNESFSIRASFPRNPNAQPPAWQAADDERAAFEQNTLPLINIVLLGLSLLIGLGGILFVLVRYLTRGVDPKLVSVPEYLSEPPSDLPPAVVGTLMDESADLRDVMSTLLDLARRGYLVIEEIQTPGLFGIGKTSSFIYKRTDKPLDGLRDFERTMLNMIFPGGSLERTLDSMRNTFYTVIPKIQKELYDSLVTEGFFRVSPYTTRTLWATGGVLVIVLAILVLVLGIFVADFTMVFFCVPAALFVVGFVWTVSARAMPAKTQKGAEEAAKWRAFETYLRNLQKYDGVETAAAQFDRFLPYAAAFGFSQAWMRQLTARPDVFVPIPPWYFPTYLGGPWGGGYRSGTPLPDAPYQMPGELVRAGGGLDQASGGLASGLESMSSGLSNMLNNASSVFSSQPQASSGSWSSGGRGFSGGGFSGGFSGGGGRGFG